MPWDVILLIAAFAVVGILIEAVADRLFGQLFGRRDRPPSDGEQGVSAH